MQIHRQFRIAYSLVVGLVSACVLASAHAATNASHAVSNIEIDEIVISGVTLFELTDLEKLLELSPGERLDRAKVVQTARSLQEIYRSSGYEQVRIESRLTPRTSAGGITENVLEFVVSEGKPTRIAAIEIEYDPPNWGKRLRSVSGKIGLNPGDVLDRERILNGYRSIQDALTAWDFLSPKIDEAVIETVDPVNPVVPSEAAGGTARWVRLKIRVHLGERVEFSYRGNTVFPNGQLSAWIEEQRLLGFSQDYVERVRNRFEEEYRRLGYAKIKIDIFTFEDPKDQRRTISYAFDEGPRVKIENITFDGNSVFDIETLQDQFDERAVPTVSRGYYVAKDMEQSAQVLIEWMKSQGYLSAKLVSIAHNYRPSGDRVDLVIYIYEGEQTIVDSLRFEGLHVFTSTELSQALGNSAGKPLNLYALNEGLELVKARYRDRGYLDIQILNESTPRLVTYAQENRIANIRLELNEGTQYYVSKIQIEGLRKTRHLSVARELELQEGDILSERLWFRSEARLRRLGIFATASIKAFPDPSRKDGKILKVVVAEGSPGLIAGGVGLRNDIGGRVFGQIQYANLWGRNHTVLLSASANRRFKRFGSTFCASGKQIAENPESDHCFVEYAATLGYVWPWFGLGETTFRPRLSLERTQFRNFDANTASFQASWDRRLVRNWGLTGVFSYSFELIEQENANVESDNQRLRIGSITPSLILDRRNNPLAPTKGTYTTLSWELARPEFLSQNSPPEDPPVAYSRLQFRNDVYFPLPRGIDFFFSFRTGLSYNLAKPPAEDPNNERYSIPLIKQFALGGVGSARGFAEQSIFIDPNIAIRGSLTYVNYRAQLDLPFAGSMKFGPFVDAFNLNLDKYSLGGLRYGVGAGFHYKSPVGPVNFDLGINPAPRLGEDNYQLHFSIGNI